MARERSSRLLRGSEIVEKPAHTSLPIETRRLEYLMSSVRLLSIQAAHILITLLTLTEQGFDCDLTAVKVKNKAP